MYSVYDSILSVQCYNVEKKGGDFDDHNRRIPTL